MSNARRQLREAFLIDDLFSAILTYAFEILTKRFPIHHHDIYRLLGFPEFLLCVDFDDHCL